MLKKVKLDEAIGMTLGHDITKVVPGKFKGPVFRRGHIIRKEDIPELLSVGKEHVYVMELSEEEIHEEEAAIRIAKAIGGSELEFSQPKEGRVNLKSKIFGLLKINVPLLKKINLLGDIVVVTLHTDMVCRAGMEVAATKTTPLFVTEAKIREIEDICEKEGKVVGVIPIKKKKIGVVITGNEVFKGRIEDKFADVIKRKMEALGSVKNDQIIVPDDANLIAQAISDMASKGNEVVVVCGGLSKDPDDVTFEGVKKSGAEIICYGSPVMPGAMFLFAVREGIPILGAPACVIYDSATVFDLILPRVLADEKICKEDIVELGHGGLCLKCEKCAFPVCPFGK